MAVNDNNNKSLYGSGEVVKDSVNAAVVQAEAAEAGAKAARDAAEGHADEAAQSVIDCQTEVTNAQAEVALANTARTGAETAETNAVLAQGSAELAQASAETAQGLAETAQAGAESAEADTLLLKGDTQAILDEFNELYWGALAAPPVDAAVTVGDLYFDTGEDNMKVCNAVSPDSWIDAASAGILDTLDETVAVASKDTFTIAYKVELGCQVFVNGIHLSSSDYTATTGSSIILDTPLVLGEHIHIVGFQTLDLYDIYTRTETDTLLDDKTDKVEAYNPNLLINGDFQVWQRGTSDTTSSSSKIYGVADRWYHYAGLVERVVSRIDGLVHRFGFKVLANAGATFSVGQVLEGGLVHQGKTVTYTAKVKVSAGATNCKIRVHDGESGVGTLLTQAFIPTGELQTVTLTGNLASFVDAVNGWSFDINCYLDAGESIELHSMKVEEGSVSTSFISRPIAEELALCQRYFEKSFQTGTTPANGSDTTSFATSAGSTSGMSSNIVPGVTQSFAVRKRVAPQMTRYGNSLGYGKKTQVSTGTTTYLLNSCDFAFVNDRSFQLLQQDVSNEIFTIACHWTADAEL